jgi:hypothetical protein
MSVPIKLPQVTYSDGWEYKTLMTEGRQWNEFDSNLRELGLDGWECIAVIQNMQRVNDYYRVFLKRRIRVPIEHQTRKEST